MALSHPGGELPSLMRAFIRGDDMDDGASEFSLSQAMEDFYLDADVFLDDSDDDSDDDSSSDEDTASDAKAGNETDDDDDNDDDDALGTTANVAFTNCDHYRPSDLPAMPVIRVHAHGTTRRPNKLTVLEKLMKHSHDIHSKDVYGNTAMHWACHGLNTIPDVDEYARRLLLRLSKELAKRDLFNEDPLAYNKKKRKQRKKRLAKNQTRRRNGLAPLPSPPEENMAMEKIERCILDIKRQLDAKESQRQNRCLALIERLQKYGGYGMLSQQNYEGLSPLHFAARTCQHPLLADSLIHGHQKSKLAMQLGMAEIFESVRDAAQKLLECDRVTLFLSDPSNSTLWSVVADRSFPIKLPWDKG